MPRKKKLNLPLLEVIGISLVIHIAALLLLGGMTLYQVIQPPEPEFEAPPVPDNPIDPQELQVRVDLQKKAKQSAQPTRRITVQNISQLNLPSMDSDIPTMNTRVAVGAGYGSGGGLGRGFGQGGLDMSKSAVSFFGIKSSGERIMIIVDASRYMLEDEKGGLPAYQIIKREVGSIVQNLSPGTLFNVMFYSGRTLEAFASNPLPATQANKDRAVNWVQKFNTSMSRVANVTNNRDVDDTSIRPINGKVNHWLKAFQVSQEQNTDAMFVLLSNWGHHPRYNTQEEKDEYLESVDWDEDDEAAWVDGVRRAREWLSQENANRRKKGVPEKIVSGNHSLIGELKKIGEIEHSLRMKPDAPFTVDEIIDYTKDLGRKYGKKYDRNPTSTNIVLFVGADEEEAAIENQAERFKDVARANRGRFRVLEGMEGLRNVTQSTPSS